MINCTNIIINQIQACVRGTSGRLAFFKAGNDCVLLENTTLNQQNLKRVELKVVTQLIKESYHSLRGKTQKIAIDILKYHIKEASWGIAKLQAKWTLLKLERGWRFFWDKEPENVHYGKDSGNLYADSYSIVDDTVYYTPEELPYNIKNEEESQDPPVPQACIKKRQDTPQIEEDEEFYDAEDGKLPIGSTDKRNLSAEIGSHSLIKENAVQDLTTILKGLGIDILECIESIEKTGSDAYKVVMKKPKIEKKVFGVTVASFSFPEQFTLKINNGVLDFGKDTVAIYAKGLPASNAHKIQYVNEEGFHKFRINEDPKNQIRFNTLIKGMKALGLI